MQSLSRFLRAAFAALSVGLLAAAGASAQDMAGARDHSAVKRFGGSTLIGYEVRNFDSVDFQTSTFRKYDLQTRSRQYAEPALRQEGQLTRLWYEAAGGTRSTELYRNYVNELKAAGFKVLYDAEQDPAATRWNSFLSGFFNNGKEWIKNNRSEFIFTAAKLDTVRTGTFQKDGTTVRVTTVDWAKADPARKVAQGAYAAVDVLEAKAMTQNMVVVSAAEIDKAIASTGKVALYGILFDTGKADIQPASAASLAQIAVFLQADAKAKLHVVGHTDNVGAFDSNIALSKRRADAVIAALGRSHGIAAARLIGHGVGSLAPVATNSTEAGRALNRRVELVLQ